MNVVAIVIAMILTDLRRWQEMLQAVAAIVEQFAANGNRKIPSRKILEINFYLL